MRYNRAGLDCPGCAAKIEKEEALARVEPDVKLRARAGADSPEADDGEAGEKSRLYLIGITTFLLIIGFFFKEPLHQTPSAWAEYLVLGAAYLLVGGKVIRTALKNLVYGRVFDENFLLSIATVGAIAIHRLTEAVVTMLFYAVGEYLQDRAVTRSRRSIAALLDIRPDYANLQVRGELLRVPPEDVQVGQTIVVKPGERVPLDGEVTEGVSFVDVSALTGECVPRKAAKGETILAGMINGQGLLTVKVTRPYRESSVARILELVEKAGARKAPTEQFITTFARYYTPVVVLGALLLAVVPPLVLPGATFAEWIYRALVLLVISCPCALVISIPLSYFGGIGGASRQGILVKGANYLEALARLHTVVFDKTGTLTRGVLRVTRVVPYNGFKEEEVLAAAAAAEVHSGHPIAQSIRRAYGRDVSPDGVSDYREIPGYGISARVEGQNVLAGNDRLLHRAGIPHDVCDIEGTGVYVAVDGVFAGYIVIADEIKPDAADALARLKRLGIRKTVMLTGDAEEAARRVAAALGIDRWFAGLLPEDKVKKVEELQAAIPQKGKQKLAFVGDGLNDAPVIIRADVGIAMGDLGSDAAIEAADVVLMEDAPSRLAAAVEIARRTARIVRQNIAAALGIKAFFLSLGTLGAATIWEAVFADVGVTLLAILNATRAMGYRRIPQPGRAESTPF